MASLINSFIPTEKIRALRPNQVEALTLVENLLEHDKNLIEIEAPPGSGKSVIADTLMNYFTEMGYSCIVTSPQNMQVDQYASSGFGMTTLKGREHYPCSAGKENCSKGFCTTKKCPDGKTKRNCKAHDYSACRKCQCNWCVYKAEFKRFRESRKANTNLTMALLGIDNRPQVWIIDEADTIEPNVRSFNSVVIPELFPHFKFPEIVPDLLDYVQRTTVTIEAMRNDHNTDTEEKLIEKLETICMKVLEVCQDYNEFKEPWCITVKTSSGKTRLEPVTVNRFLKDLFNQKIIIMMSATPPHYPGFEKVRVESVFPIASRQWVYDPFPGSMVKKQRDVSIPRAAVWLASLKGKTIVHCKSYETADKLHRNLQVIKRHSLLQVNNDNDGDGVRYSRYDAVDAFLRSRNPDEILISVNQSRGLDLWDPTVVNNVIAVVPWQNPTDTLTKMKTEILGESWKNQEIANEITQAIARHFRNEKMGTYLGKEVPKRAYIIDASFGNWYQRNKGLFPKNFTESQRL